MTTGIIRRFDDLGRIVIPQGIRKRLNISENSPMEIGIYCNSITLTPYFPEDENTAEKIKEMLKNLSKEERKEILADFLR